MKFWNVVWFRFENERKQMKVLLQFDITNTSDEYHKKFGSRPGTFFYILVRKTLIFSYIAAFAAAAYIFGRMYLPSKTALRIGDYALGLFSVAYLVFFVHKVVSAWVKSGWRRLPVNYPSLPKQMLKATGILMVVAAHFVVVYTIAIRSVYEGLNARGVFGDSFGALNSLVSTGALIGVLITLWLQYRQQSEDRKENLKRQRDQQKEAEMRRRERWPVLATKELLGNVLLSGINEAGQPLFEFSVKYGVYNCSRCVVLNVANLVSVYQNKIENSVFMRRADVRTYIESQKGCDFSINFVLPLQKNRDSIEELLSNDSVVLRVQNVFATALQFYYSIEEEYALTIEGEGETLPTLKAWRDALADVQKKKSGRATTLTGRNETLVKELQKKGVDKDKIVALTFKARPTKYKLSEISEEQYLKFIDSSAT